MRRTSSSSAACLSVLLVAGEYATASSARPADTATPKSVVIIAPSPSIAESQIANSYFAKHVFRRDREAMPPHVHQRTKLFRDLGSVTYSAREPRGSSCPTHPPTDLRAC